MGERAVSKGTRNKKIVDLVKRTAVPFRNSG